MRSARPDRRHRRDLPRHARLTGDTDFLYDCDHANAGRLWNALVEFWGGSVPVVANAEELADPSLVVQFGRPPNRIDLIGGLESVPFVEAWAHRIREKIDVSGTEVPIYILGLAELRRAKRQAGRPKDLDDLANLPE